MTEIKTIKSCGECPCYNYQDEMMSQTCMLDFDINFEWRDKYQSGRYKAKYTKHDVNFIHPNCPLLKTNILLTAINNAKNINK